MAKKKSRVLKKIRENLANGGGLHNSCQAAGVNFTTVWGWRKKWKRIDNYINKILEGRIQLVEDALYKSALKGNIVSQIFFLKNRAPDKWRADKQIENETVRVINIINAYRTQPNVSPIRERHE